MPEDGANDSVDGSLKYPTFDHGQELFVVNHSAESVEFSAGLAGQFIRSTLVLDPGDLR